MTKSNARQKRTRYCVKRGFLWGGVLTVILLAVFLFPNSRSLYALTNIWYSSSTSADHIPLGEKEDDLISVVVSGKNNNSSGTSGTSGTPGTSENSGTPGNSENIKNQEALNHMGNDDKLDTPDTPESSDLSKELAAKSESLNGKDNQGSQPPSASENPNSSATVENMGQTDQEAKPKITVFRGNPKAGKKVALTFDDGPYAVWTAEYLKVLEEYEVPAAFFLVGTRVEKYQEIANKISEKGFDLGSHSYRHGKLTLAKPEKLDQDFRKTIAALSIAGDVEYFRPPYGDYNQMVIKTAAKHGLKTICWNVDPRDWETEDSGKIVQRVLSHTKDGSIILLHEGRKSTLAALPRIITGLKDQGYQLVRISELME